jgi:hypothetical protein
LYLVGGGVSASAATGVIVYVVVIVAAASPASVAVVNRGYFLFLKWCVLLITLCVVLLSCWRHT